MTAPNRNTTMMVCPRNYTLRTTLGHVIGFNAGEPTPVPNECVELALAVNILPAPDVTLPAHKDLPATGFAKIVAMPQLLREAMVLRCIDEMVRENDTANFSGGGRPKVTAIKNRISVDVNQQEVDKAWNRYRDLKATAEDLPTYKNLDLVYDIQQTSSPKSLRDFAKDLEIPAAEVTGLSIAELKATLVARAVNYNSEAKALELAAAKLDEAIDD